MAVVGTFLAPDCFPNTQSLVLDSPLLSAFGPKLLPLPSVPDFLESSARCSCPLQRLFGLISFFLLFFPCPH